MVKVVNPQRMAERIFGSSFQCCLPAELDIQIQEGIDSLKKKSTSREWNSLVKDMGYSAAAIRSRIVLYVHCMFILAEDRLFLKMFLKNPPPVPQDFGLQYCSSI